MRHLAFWLLAATLFVISVVLTAGGAVLIGAGGSLYYLAAGLAVFAAGAALVRRNGYAAIIYAGMLVVTLGWGLYEVGLDGWALASRLAAPAVLGCTLLLLPVSACSRYSGKVWLSIALVASFGVLALCGSIAAVPQAAVALPAQARASQGPAEWRNWGNTPGGQRYAPLDQINTSNVNLLRPAWRYDSPVPPQSAPSMESTPLAVDGRLYTCLQPGVVTALDQDTGRQIWLYKSPAYANADFRPLFGGKCRGVSYFESAAHEPQCQKRILFATSDGYLMAVDATDGQPCTEFGEVGSVDLAEGMGLPGPRSLVTAMSSSPPAIIRGVAVIGQSVSDLASLHGPSGVIRGYDAETGKLRWAWDIGKPGQMRLRPGETYTPATPNAWGVFSGDEELGLVFVPTGNSLPDYYGGQRSKVSEQYSSSVVALDATTGQPRWSFQTVHHDLWDRDIAAQPVTVDIPSAGRTIAALLVPTKTGQLFVLDRATGQPVDRVVERPAPQGAVRGDWNSPTQPWTTGFPSLAGPDLRETDMWGLTPLDQMLCRIRFRRLRYEGQFTPVTTRDTLIYPGTAGGINWGSVSVDPNAGLMIVNSLYLAHVGRLIPKDASGKPLLGDEKPAALFEQAGTPYAFSLTAFLSPLGAPCQRPPYGKISAFDLKTRKLVWSRSLGTAEHSGPFGLSSHLPIAMGAPNSGGSMVTAGGLAFIGATPDRRLRAYDVRSGRELWSASLPAIGAATPMTYVSPTTGRQYVVIAAGGRSGIPGPAGKSLLAFALPQKAGEDASTPVGGL
jgi:quinoprotein glucose dehydrogenase